MKKEKIIQLLKNEDIEYVINITINPEFIKIDYRNKLGDLRKIIQEF